MPRGQRRYPFVHRDLLAVSSTDLAVGLAPSMGLVVTTAVILLSALLGAEALTSGT